MRQNHLSVSALLVLALVSTTATPVVYAATELARVNETVIQLEEFNKRYKDNLKFFQFRAPSKKNVLDDIIKRELGIQEARRQGLDKDPEILERMNTVLYQALLEKKLAKSVEQIFVTDDEAKAFYGKNPELRTSHIFIAVRPDATTEQDKKARERIEGIRDNQLKDPKMSFAEVAQRFSEGAAAPMGGDIDYQTRDRLDPVYYETALNLKTPGKVSNVIRTQFGYHIVKLTGIRPWQEVDKAQIKRLVFEDRRNDLFEKYMGELRKRAKVSVRTDLLKD